MRPDPIELDALVEKVQKGDRDAFGDVVAAVQRELRIFVSTYAYSVDMMEEVVQGALVTCYENIGKYELRRTFLSWVKGIARNVVRSEARDRAKYVSAEEDALEELLVRAGADAVEEESEYEESWIERLRECLKKTPGDVRSLLDRRYGDGQPIAGIAEHLGKSESWVAVTLFRTRERLKKCMAAEAAGQME